MSKPCEYVEGKHSRKRSGRSVFSMFLPSVAGTGVVGDEATGPISISTCRSL